MADVTQEISSHKNNRIQDILSTLPLCMVLVAGSFISWFKIAPVSFFYEGIVFAAAEISFCLCAFYSALSNKNKKWAFFIPAGGAVVLTLIRARQVGNGLVSFLNICIHSWNTKYEDGVRLFDQAQARETDLFFVLSCFYAAFRGCFVVSDQCRRLCPDQHDRTAYFCAGDSIGTFLSIWRCAYVKLYYRCMAFFPSCRHPFKARNLDGSSGSVPCVRLAYRRRKILTDSA